MNIVMILAGGVGKRVGSVSSTGEYIPKQFVEVLGKPILAYTCEIFEQHLDIDAVQIVCHRDWVDYCQEMCKTFNLVKVKWIVPGGDTFQDSVVNGMNYLKSLLIEEGGNGSVKINDNIFIQYGGAPFTSHKIVSAVIEMTKERGSAVTSTPCYQLLASKDTETESMTWKDRDRYVQIACPYGFRFSYLLNIYERAEEQGLLDTIDPHTTSLMYALGDVVNLAYGDQTNIKITTAEDIHLFEGYILMKQRREVAGKK